MRHFLWVVCLAVGCTTSDGNGDGTCPLAMATADTGMLTAAKAQMCNVNGSGGTVHWYKLSAALPGSMSYVQVELWDNIGAFGGVAVHTGSFPIDTDPATCGVCVRGLGNKGAAGAKEYVATSGTVHVTAVGSDGQPFSATLSNIAFAEVDAAHHVVADGCTATLAAARVDGTVMKVGGTGGGGGGGNGSGQCATTVGD
jgi:hypothetical protein